MPSICRLSPTLRVATCDRFDKLDATKVDSQAKGNARDVGFESYEGPAFACKTRIRQRGKCRPKIKAN